MIEILGQIPGAQTTITSSQIVWQTLVQVTTALIASGTLIAILAYLSKALLQQWLTKELEAYKEKLGHELSIARLEHDVVYKRVDEKVAIALTGVYERLQPLYELVESYCKVVETSAQGTKEEKLERVQKSNAEFWSFFLSNRPYIPPKLFKSTRSIADQLVNATYTMHSILQREERGSFDDGDGEDAWLSNHQRLNKEISELFTTLIGEIQTRLGVKDLD